MARWRNTNYSEHAPDSPNERFGPGSSSMTRFADLFDGSFQGRLQAAYDFLGYGLVINSGTTAPDGSTLYYIHRVIPMAYPGLPANIFLPAAPGDLAPGTYPPGIINKFFVLAITKTEPLGQPTGVDLDATPVGTAAGMYKRARLSLECSTVPWAIIDDPTLIAQGGSTNGFPDEGAALAKGWQFTRYIMRRREAFSRLIKIPYGVMQTNAPGQNNQQKINPTALPFREGGANFTYTWMRVPLTSGPVPGFNESRIGSALGMLNNATFDGKAAGTLLLDSYSTREYQGSFGEWLADVSFNMIYLPHNSSGNRLAAYNNLVLAGQSPPLPVSPSGATLTKGTPTGWNTLVDVDAFGNWDYYDVMTAKGLQKPFQTTDFSALFRP